MNRARVLLLGAATLAGCGGENLILPAEGAPANATLIAGDSQSDTVGRPLPELIVLRITDSKNRPVQHQPVTFSALVNGAAAQFIPDTARTDADGRAEARWVLGTSRGAQTIRAQVEGAGPLFVDLSALAAADVPVALLRVSGDSQQGTAGNRLPEPLVVQLADRFGNGVDGRVVAWTVASGGGAATPATTPLDSSGNAVTILTLGPAAGRNTISARSAGFSVQFTAMATLITGAAATATVTTQPSATVANTIVFPVQPEVRITDPNGQPVAQVAVRVTVASGGGVLSGSTSLLTDANGTAAFAGLSLTGAAGIRTLSFTVGTVSATSAAVSVTPGPADAARSTVTVPGGVAGTPTTVTVRTRDISDNVTTLGASIGISIGGANSATPAVTDHHDGSYTAAYTPTQSGTDLITVSLNGAAVGTSPYSGAVQAGPLSGSHSSLQALPVQISASAGGSTAAVTLAARDAFGNAIAGVTVSFSASGAGHTLTPASVSTTSGGQAMTSFSSTLAGAATISAQVNGVTLTQTVTVLPAAADPAMSGATVPGGQRHQATTITVISRDHFGNALLAGGHQVTITVSGSNRAGPLSATDNGDGSYTATYTPAARGTDLIAVTLDGAAIGGSPYQSRVR